MGHGRNERLFERWRRRGDAAALGRVFDLTAPEVLRVASHLVRGPVEAEDLLQDTFLTAIERATTWDADRPLVPWLVGILRNHARHARRPRGMDAVDAVADRPVADREPVDAVPWTESVSAAIHALPSPYREVLVLRLRHGMEPAEIALVHDVPPATIRSQLHRGLDRLRRLLPASAAGLAAVPAPRGLLSVRGVVLARAAHGPVTAGAGAVALGGIVMTKALAATSIAILALALCTGLAWVGGAFEPRVGEPGAGPPGRNDAGASPGPSLAAGATPAAASTRAAGDPSAGGETAAAAPSTSPAGAKGVLAGRLRFADGRPLADVPLATNIGSLVRIVRSGPDGSFRFEDLDDGELPLVVRTDEFQVLLAQVDVRPGRRTDVDLVVDEGLRVDGVVVDATTSDPLAGVSLVLRRPGATEAQAGFAFAKTDARGAYRFDLLPPTAYTLELAKATYEATLRPVDLATRPWPSRIALPRARPWVLVLDGIDAAAVGRSLSWQLNRVNETLFLDGSARVGADGRATIQAPMPGRYSLRIPATAWTPAVDREVRIPEGEIPPLSLPMGLPLGRVTGTVRHESGAPATGLRVLVGAVSVVTDEDGRFAAERVAPGEQALRLSNGVDTSSTVAFVQVPALGSTDVVVTVPTGALEGVLLCDGAPMPRYGNLGITVATEGETGRHVAEGRAGVDGRFVLPWLSAGSYRLLFWSGDARPQTRSVTLAGGERRDLGTVDLERYERVPLRVLAPDGPPPSVLHVEALDAETLTPTLDLGGGQSFGLQPSVVADGSGPRLRGLPAGTYRLTFRAEGFLPAEVAATIRRGHDTPIDVRLQRP